MGEGTAKSWVAAVAERGVTTIMQKNNKRRRVKYFIKINTRLSIKVLCEGCQDRILHANDWNFCKNRIKYGYMINVRQAIAEDKKDVLSLLDEFLTHIEESKGYGSHEPTEVVGSKLFDDLISEDKFKIFVAEEEGKIIGVATLFLYPIIRRGQYRGQLEELVVTKSMRGKGAGSKLLEAVKDYCENNNILSLRLNSEINLTEAHKFYEVHGGKFTEKMFRFDF